MSMPNNKSLLSSFLLINEVENPDKYKDKYKDTGVSVTAY